MIQTITDTTIYGEEIRTSNAKMEEVFALWEKILREPVTSELYAVYYNYESNHTGTYDLCIGSTQNTNQPSMVTIAAGKYQVFTVPNGQAGLGEAWQEIWTDAKLEEKRAYRTDFEYYKQDGSVEIYLSIK